MRIRRSAPILLTVCLLFAPSAILNASTATPPATGQRPTQPADIPKRVENAAAMIAGARAEWEYWSTVPADRRTLEKNMRVPYKMLWIGYLNGTCNGKKYTMTESEKTLLKDTAAEFERKVETWSDHNVDIQIELVFSGLEVDVSNTTLHAITPDIVASDIEKFAPPGTYDSIITASSIDDSVLGLKTQGISDTFGYSTFQINCRGYDTVTKNIAVAIHEWLHQFEALAQIIGVAFPPTHLYQGEPDYPGYEKYTSHPTEDYMALYEEMFRGTVKFSGENGVRYIGVFPQMWRVNHRLLNLATVTLKNVETGRFISADDTAVTHHPSANSPAQKWILKYSGDGTVGFFSRAKPWLRLDVKNGFWKNPFHLYSSNSRYPTAQNFRLVRNSDGTHLLQSTYPGKDTGLKTPPVMRAADTVLRLAEENPNDPAQRWEVRPEGN